MRKQLPQVFILLILLISLDSCRRSASVSTETVDPNTHQASSETEADYEQEAKVYESEDRVIWQKPDLVVKQLGDVEGKVVADLGAGTGYFSRRIAYKGAKVIAIDIDPKAVQWMEEQKARFPLELRDRLIIRLATPEDPQLKPDEVDIVLLVNTYTYIPDRINYFTKLKTAIRKGGDVVIIDFKKLDTPFGPPLAERVDLKVVLDELKAAGYSILHTDEASLEYQYIIKAQRD